MDQDCKNTYPYGTTKTNYWDLNINKNTNWYMTGPNISRMVKWCGHKLVQIIGQEIILLLINYYLLLLYIILNVFLILGNYVRRECFVGTNCQSFDPSKVQCDKEGNMPIHILDKYCEETDTRYNIYPLTVIQAILMV